MVCYSDISMIVIAVAIACAAVLLGRTLEPRACGEGSCFGVARTVVCVVLLFALGGVVYLRWTVLPTSLVIIVLAGVYFRVARAASLQECAYLGCVFFLMYDFAVLLGVNVLRESFDAVVGEGAWFRAGAGAQAASVAVISGALLGLVALVRKLAVPSEYKLTAAQTSLVLIPMVSYLYVRSGLYITSYNGGAIEHFQGELVLILLSLLPTISVVVGLMNVLNAQITRGEVLEMRELMAKQAQQYLIKRETIDLVNRKYHDMRHFASVIDGNGNGATVPVGEGERRNLERDLERCSVFVDTGSPIVDVIVSDKVLACNERDIRLVPFIDARTLGFMGSLDLCTLFGNALDNAIEATELVENPELREIKVKVAPVNDMVAFSFVNRYAVEPKVVDGVLLSTKGRLEGGHATNTGKGPAVADGVVDDEPHGYGMKNIRRVVESYGGEATFSARDGIFTLNLLVPLPVEPAPHG